MCKRYPLECAMPNCLNTIPPHYIWGESCYQATTHDRGVKRHYIPGVKPSGYCGFTQVMEPYKHPYMLCEFHYKQRNREEEERKKKKEEEEESKKKELKDREREGIPRGMGHLID
ncbi:hypothetical protein COCC4DRAFT_18635 [Bipolaris maydis ATCC 48331]|uniref:Uncharacterized protein n=2 Tax=Cochliobolus heterostrophus TaxID=5016 RepID=M2V7K0_COCH5|nr:uncharacterized protein COCC4DRAFT_18635 [Bipolaris maydis ATCC 48331]EMD95723.1 hypothetical protein COCHEDRAFT_1026557 [Bipolaris maydis C5]KAH7561645.1 hypothetical protein BM1_02749 [Bipolaris maydis]ENI10583.1 hypothetical protein COCC4DRAFT_18635 [Bipolaris maydis ATCC 48331]KAJ5030455.1 hypothetical protein J3E73DRAFT_253575 [Bipolaris maydis]KAJ6274703.1 hypothetical protein PSV08DRAFT_243762 [Bipolaris maydis]